MSTVARQLPKVLVVGRGTGGCSTAGNLLNKSKFQAVMIPERKAIALSRNFPLWLWKDSLNVLKDMGIQKPITPLLTRVNSRHYFDHLGTLLSNNSMYGSCFIAPVSNIVNEMNERCQELGIVTRDKFIDSAKYQDDNKVMVTFNDQTTESFDFVAGAEGVPFDGVETGSLTTRNILYPNTKTFYPTTTVFIDATVPPHHFDQQVRELANFIPPSEMWLYSNRNTSEVVSMVTYKCAHHHQIETEYTPSHFIQFKVIAESLEEAQRITRMQHTELYDLIKSRFSSFEGAVPWALNGLASYVEDTNHCQFRAFVASSVTIDGPWYNKRVAVLGDQAHADLNWMDGAQAIDDGKAMADSLIASVDPNDVQKFEPFLLEENLKTTFNETRQNAVRNVSRISQKEDPFSIQTMGAAGLLMRQIWIAFDQVCDMIPYIPMIVGEASRTTLPAPGPEWDYDDDDD